VSAFIESNCLKHPKSPYLEKYVINKHDKEFDLLQDVRKHLSAEFRDGLTTENLVKLFEFVISPANRIVSGAVYTPLKVRKTILQNVLGDKREEELRTLRVADISCGCGGFLMDAALWIHKKTRKPYVEIFRDNIFGIDIQNYAIERAKILLSLLALSEGEDVNFEFNLLCRDTLDFIKKDWDINYWGFDVIVGNPPYVCSRNLTEETHKKLKKYEVCSSGHPDLYIPFFQIAIDMLNDEGRLGYITMNSFLRSVNGRAIRNYFSNNRFSISIVDFRGYQVFESKNTYTCLFYLDKRRNSESVKYTVDEQGTLSSDDVLYTSVQYDNLDNEKGWTLNNFDTTRAIEATGVQIKDFCPSRHGIATLSNDTYIFKPIDEDEKFFYINDKGKKYPIEKNICRDIVNPNKLNTVADINTMMEKVIFPYRVDDGRASVYSPDEMRYLFPKTYAYLKTKKDLLLKRDKGETKDYPQWYAFGRTQSLVMPRYKLFFPKFANRPLHCIICDAPNLMLYNGLAFVNTDKRILRIIKALIESELFWSYIQTNAKPYASGYYSLSGVDIKHFGIPRFSIEEEEELLSINDKPEIEKWLRKRYEAILQH
jgi:type I restriction-modification system DNA methylase subunit